MGGPITVKLIDSPNPRFPNAIICKIMPVVFWQKEFGRCVGVRLLRPSNMEGRAFEARILQCVIGWQLGLSRSAKD